MSQQGGLSADDFAAFYEAVHGFAPFAWQRRAAAELVDGSLWPTLEAPTGAGKTSLIDCVVFALACQVGKGGERTVPLRTFWCVDRRSVIDQVFAHAERLGTALERGGGVVSAVRERLERIDGLGGLVVQRWRGGLEESPEPLRITGPAVICSTVDQLGSRLLFRGYGTSRASRPLDAALVGNDSFIALDEAHIVEPFLQTLGAVRRLAQPHDGNAPTRPIHSLVLSATLPSDAPAGFVLNEQEKQDQLIAKRLSCLKRIRLSKSRQLVSEAAKLAAGAPTSTPPVIGIVANTVGTARATYTKLVEQGRSAILVIGPCRPFERDGLLGEIPARADRTNLDAPLFVVATQTIEVGVDLDFDGLVTEACPLASLVQRLGRLDRYGELYADTAEPGIATVVASGRDDPVYGKTALETWQWLEQHADDGGLLLDAKHIAGLRAEDPPEAERPLTPVLAEWHVEALVQTSIDPAPTPAIGPFLHGDEALDVADVRLVWRGDFDVDGSRWIEIARLCPPRPHEAISLPIGRVRSWLLGSPKAAQADFGDLDPAGSDSEGVRREGGRRAVRWDRKEPQAVDAEAIKPGDTLLVPAAYGGVDKYGWDPARTDAVEDVADFAPSGRRLRVSQSLAHISAPMQGAVEQPQERLQAGEIDSREAYAHALAALRDLPEDEIEPRLRATLATLPSHGELTPHPGGGVVLLGKALGSGDAQPRRISYEAHVDGVVDRVTATAAALRLDESLADALVEAARLHDAGKLDPRFQAWMHGTSEAGTPLLAKSGRHSRTPLDRRLRDQAGWPAGARHELWSAALADRLCAITHSDERELITHLIAAHHGQHRPFYGREADAEPIEIEFEDAGSEKISLPSNARVSWPEHARRFVKLNHRFGPWGLAALEAALVLSDHAVSAREQLGP